MTGFIFVDGRQNDRSTQRRMRRHVMKGKNTGKTLQRASRLPPGKQLIRQREVQSKTDLPLSPNSRLPVSRLPSIHSTPPMTLSQQLTILQRLPPSAAFHSPVAMTAYAWQVIDECKSPVCSNSIPCCLLRSRVLFASLTRRGEQTLTASSTSNASMPHPLASLPTRPNRSGSSPYLPTKQPTTVLWPSCRPVTKPCLVQPQVVFWPAAASPMQTMWPNPCAS